MNNELVPQSNDVIIYSSPDGEIRLEVVSQNETFCLQFNEHQILDASGHVFDEVAVKLAGEEFSKLHAIQDYDFENDFEEAAKKITESYQPGKKKS
jgi:hypothetical protein